MPRHKQYTSRCGCLTSDPIPYRQDYYPEMTDKEWYSKVWKPFFEQWHALMCKHEAGGAAVCPVAAARKAQGHFNEA